MKILERSLCNYKNFYTSSVKIQDATIEPKEVTNAIEKYVNSNQYDGTGDIFAVITRKISNVEFLIKFVEVGYNKPNKIVPHRIIYKALSNANIVYYNYRILGCGGIRIYE